MPGGPARPYPDGVITEPPVPDGRRRTGARDGADSLPTTALPVVPDPATGDTVPIVLPPAGQPTADPALVAFTPTPEHLVSAPPLRRRRFSRVIAALVVPLVALLGLSGYLVVATHEHQRASAEWRTLAERKADELATTQRDLDGATSELAAVRDQLATATTRITELANEKAQIGDEIATQQQLADYQKRIGAAAATVASALDRCVTAQQTLIGYLRDAASYDSTDLARYSSDVDALCRSAQNANTSLQAELAK